MCLSFANTLLIDNLIFYEIFLLRFLVPASVFVVLYLLLFVAQVRLNYPLL
jgi:hypothetical protein